MAGSEPAVGRLRPESSASSRARISTARAEAARTYLAARLKKIGAKGVTVTAKGYGAKNPVASNLTYNGRRQNRRVEIWAKK